MLDPVIGRDEEIRRVIQVLSRRKKNNPVLIGEPGVGKTAILEGLAIRIAQDDVPEKLKDSNLFGFDFDLALAHQRLHLLFISKLVLIFCIAIWLKGSN